MKAVVGIDGSKYGDWALEWVAKLPLKTTPSIVTIGGGTGTFMVLSALKEYPVHLSAVISMADDGGSTGIGLLGGRLLQFSGELTF